MLRLLACETLFDREVHANRETGHQKEMIINENRRSLENRTSDARLEFFSTSMTRE